MYLLIKGLYLSTSSLQSCHNTIVLCTIIHKRGIFEFSDEKNISKRESRAVLFTILIEKMFVFLYYGNSVSLPSLR